MCYSYGGLGKKTVNFILIRKSLKCFNKQRFMRLCEAFFFIFRGVTLPPRGLDKYCSIKFVLLYFFFLNRRQILQKKCYFQWVQVCLFGLTGGLWEFCLLMC